MFAQKKKWRKLLCVCTLVEDKTIDPVTVRRSALVLPGTNILLIMLSWLSFAVVLGNVMAHILT
jgi:hypothetical protein